MSAVGAVREPPLRPKEMTHHRDHGVHRERQELFFSVVSVASLVSFCFVGAALAAARLETIHRPA